MSLDLFQRETNERMQRMGGVTQADVGAWDGYIRGTALKTMRGFAQAGSAIDLLGAVVPVVEDAFTGGTVAQDRYFRQHDEEAGKAIDFWTPRPGEVGMAAEITGSLLSMLPMVIASPPLAVGTTQVSIAEELVKKGVDARTAQAVGASQAVGLGLGIWAPILGRTLTERVLVGGAGFNVAQGVGMRAAGDVLLKGTPAEDMFDALGPTDLTIDLLLGMAFGGIVHLSPSGRAQSEEVWHRMEDWAKGMKRSERDALAVLRQFKHLNIDSLPGRPVEPVDLDRHVARTRRAIEQIAMDEPVNVSDLEQPRFEPDPERSQEARRNVRVLRDVAEQVRIDEGLPRAQMEIPENPNLRPNQKEVEARARQQVMQDLEGQIEAYTKLPDSKGGKILNTDVARELFPDYVKARHLHSSSVHEPASAVIKELYARKIAEPDPNGLDIVTFTAGGTGAGKTTTLGAIESARKIVESSQLVYDTNMATFRGAADKIDMAIQHGKEVKILYVATDPVEALKRALKRAMRTGRTVPINEHAKTHTGSVDTVMQLMERYTGDDRVQFLFLDNSIGAKGKVGLIDAAEAPAFLRRLDFDKLEVRLQETLDAELQAGRISEEIYRGTAPTLPEGEGVTPRAGSAEGPAAGRGPSGQRSPAQAVKAIPESEAPAAMRGGAASPPQRGVRGAEAADAEDPLRLAALRAVAEQPDLMLRVGEDADGRPVLKTMKEYLDEARATADDARADVPLLKTAAECLFGRAA